MANKKKSQCDMGRGKGKASVTGGGGCKKVKK